MAILLLQKLKVSEVIRVAVTLYRSNFSRLWVLSGLLALLAALDAMVGRLVPLYSLSPAWKIFYLSGSLILGLLDIYFNSVLLHRMAVLSEQKALTLRDSLVLVGKISDKILAAALLATLGVLLGGMLLVVPGLYLLSIFFLVRPLIVLENKGVWEAFRESFKLIKGEWFASSAIFVMATLALYFGAFFILLLAKPTSSTVSYFIGIGLNCLGILFLRPLYTSLVLVQFRQLQLRNSSRTIEG